MSKKSTKSTPKKVAKLTPKKKKQLGRKTKLNPEMIKAIVKHIEAGVTVVGICGLVGIAETNYYKWFEYAEDSKKDDIFRQFRQSVKKAEGKFEAGLVKKIEQDPAWQSNAWLLERRFPKRWGKTDRMQIEGVEGKPEPQVIIYLPHNERNKIKPLPNRENEFTIDYSP